MGRTRDITVDGMRIEYLKGRRALRLTADGGKGPVEVTLASLVDGLDIDRPELAPRPGLLLFAGLYARPRGGAGDFVGWYQSEADGRAAFRELRATRSDEEGWAELVALDRGGRPRAVAWFGRRDGERHLRAVGERSHHPAQRGARGHLRLLLR